MNKKKTIGYIENGIVIDHIPSGKIWRVAEILGINNTDYGRVSLGDGYGSKKIGKKGILKVEGIKLFKKQLNLIALVAENASVSVIEGGLVREKVNVNIPKQLEGVVLCPNINCITNDDHERVDPKIKYFGGTFSCHYCSREFGKKEMSFNY